MGQYGYVHFWENLNISMVKLAGFREEGIAIVIPFKGYLTQAIFEFKKAASTGLTSLNAFIGIKN